MDTNNTMGGEENNEANKVSEVRVISVDPKQIASSIIVAGVIIAGAILLKGSGGFLAQAPAQGTNNPPPAQVGNVAPVTPADRVLGNPSAKATVVMYEDFQCPFCGRFFTDSEAAIRDTYLKDGTVRLVYRDFAFLGPESNRAAEAARCAGDQGKFWEYHDYLFNHQNGENKGSFSDDYLKSFARTLGLTSQFDSCLQNGTHKQEVLDSTSEGTAAGVHGTPKGYILKNGKAVDTIDGAIPYAQVKPKIDAALK